MLTIFLLQRNARLNIESKVDKLAQQTSADHTAVNKQIADMGLTIAREYVTQREFAAVTSDLRSTLGEVKHDVGGVRERVDRIIEGRGAG